MVWVTGATTEKGKATIAMVGATAARGSVKKKTSSDYNVTLVHVTFMTLAYDI